MNNDNKIGIEKDLMEELEENIQFRDEFKKCMRRYASGDKGLIGDKKLKTHSISVKNKKYNVHSEYDTFIGRIKIYKDAKSNDILVVKSDKIKSCSSVTADKQQTQDHQ